MVFEMPGNDDSWYVYLRLVTSVEDGWMDDLRFYVPFLTVFQSYQDDVWMIMKGCVQWNSVYG